MVIKELNQNSDYQVYISLSHKAGDRSVMFERNKSHDDVPLTICYNLGSDFSLRTEEEKKVRVLAMLKMLRAGVNQAMEQIGSLVGAHPPTLLPHELQLPTGGKN
jgi:hypothetical protein